jgi:signal transduction histidine kinase
VSLEVAAANRTLRLKVIDDGVGFVPGQRRVRSLGLASMRERALLLGGSVDIQSAPGRGTTVNVAVPLKLVEG